MAGLLLRRFFFLGAWLGNGDCGARLLRWDQEADFEERFTSSERMMASAICFMDLRVWRLCCWMVR